MASAAHGAGPRAGPDSFKPLPMTIGGIVMIYVSDSVRCRCASDTIASVCLHQVLQGNARSMSTRRCKCSRTAGLLRPRWNRARKQNSTSYCGWMGNERKWCRMECSAMLYRDVVSGQQQLRSQRFIRGLEPGGPRSRALGPVSATYT